MSAKTIEQKSKNSNTKKTSIALFDLGKSSVEKRKFTLVALATWLRVYMPKNIEKIGKSDIQRNEKKTAIAPVYPSRKAEIYPSASPSARCSLSSSN